MTTDARSESRRAERKPVRKAVVLMIESDEAEDQCEGKTVDMSVHGARVESEAALTPGQILNLIQPDDPTRALRCTVVWSGDVSTDSQDKVGLEFLNSLPSGPEN
jgi:hypothetical protein